MSAQPEDRIVVDMRCQPLGQWRWDLAHFPNMRRNQRLQERLARGESPVELRTGEDVADVLVQDMDAGGVDLALCSRHDLRTSAMSHPVSTNGELYKLCQKHPDRLTFVPHVGPILDRGVENAIWELEHWVTSAGCRVVTWYPPEDTAINDVRLWPFYERCEQLGTILCVHTGIAYTLPQVTRLSHPLLLEEVCTAFPDLRLVALNFGWPAYRPLITLLVKCENLYAAVSGPVERDLRRGWWTAHHPIGEAVRDGVGDKLVWGSSWPLARYAQAVPALWGFEGLPERRRVGFGLPPVTPELKRNILGGTAARLLGLPITTSQTRALRADAVRVPSA